MGYCVEFALSGFNLLGSLTISEQYYFRTVFTLFVSSATQMLIKEKCPHIKAKEKVNSECIWDSPLRISHRELCRNSSRTTRAFASQKTTLHLFLYK